MATEHTTPRPAAAVVSADHRRRATRAAFVGTALEYYDFSLYASASATVFAVVYFSGASAEIAAFQAIATWAVGFVFRPVAAVVLGGLGDRTGRRSVLIATLLLMGVATMLIGVLPGNDQIGWLAPVLLIFLRLVQGVGAAGEFAGATLVAIEFSERRRRGISGSFPSAGTQIGGILGAGMLLLFSSLLSREQFLAWGWRVPFLIGFVLVGYALWVRLRLPETPEYERAHAAGNLSKTPIRDALRSYPWSIAVLVLVVATQIGIGYFFFIFMLSFAVNSLGVASTVTLVALMIAQVGGLLVWPLIGHVSDRVGRLPIIFFSFAFTALFAFPAFWLIEGGSATGFIVMLTLGNTFGAASYAVMGTYISELFPTGHRYTVTAITRETGTALGALTVPTTAAALAFQSGPAVLPWFLIAVAAIGTVAVTLVSRTTESMGEEPAPEPV